MHEICVRQVASFCPPNSLLQQCRLHLLSTSMMWLILFPFLLSSPLPVKKSHPGWMKNNFAVFFSSFSFSLFPLTNADCLFHSISQAVIRINWLKTSITLLYRWCHPATRAYFVFVEEHLCPADRITLDWRLIKWWSAVCASAGGCDNVHSWLSFIKSEPQQWPRTKMVLFFSAHRLKTRRLAYITHYPNIVAVNCAVR